MVALERGVNMADAELLPPPLPTSKYTGEPSVCVCVRGKAQVSQFVRASNSERRSPGSASPNTYRADSKTGGEGSSGWVRGGGGGLSLIRTHTPRLIYPSEIQVQHGDSTLRPVQKPGAAMQRWLNAPESR